ncbi:MAG: FAD-dependent oxidoreductase, partial [Pseudomonadota bacterium]
VFNGDPNALATGLLGDAVRPAARALRTFDRSLSAYVWTFAGRPEGFDLAHHNVFFGLDYTQEFRDLFDIRRVPIAPTIYLCAQDRNDAGTPAQSPERFQIIMNAPADGDVVTPTEQEIRQCETRTFERLAAAGLELAPPTAENALTTPWDFNQLFPGAGGAIYGAHPHSLMASFRRPQARTKIAGLYLAGGSVHPGPGVPMAALSGRHAAAAILQDRASTSLSIGMDTRGGTSTGLAMTASAASRSSASSARFFRRITLGRGERNP